MPAMPRAIREARMDRILSRVLGRVRLSDLGWTEDRARQFDEAAAGKPDLYPAASRWSSTTTTASMWTRGSGTR